MPDAAHIGTDKLQAKTEVDRSGTYCRTGVINGRYATINGPAFIKIRVRRRRRRGADVTTARS